MDRNITLKLYNSSMGESLRTLSSRANVPIGFEALPEDGKSSRTINFHLRASVREMLNRIVRPDRRYRWELKDGVVNVMPQESAGNGLLDVVIQNVSLKDVDAEQLGTLILDLPEVRAKLGELGLTGSKTSEYDGPLRNLPVFSISKTHIVLRDLLNEVLRRGYTEYWIAMRYGDLNQYVAIRL